MNKLHFTRLSVRSALFWGLFLLPLAGVSFTRAETLQKVHGIASIYFSRNTTDERFDCNGDRTQLTPTGSRNGALTTRVPTIQADYDVTNRLEVEVLIPIVLISEVWSVGLNTQNFITPRRAEASGIASARERRVQPRARAVFPDSAPRVQEQRKFEGTPADAIARAVAN